MDCIETAIKNGENKSKYTKYNAQTWDDFNECANGKKIVLWGLGKLSYLIGNRVCSKYYISYAIDSDENKNGFKLNTFFDFAEYNRNDINVNTPDILDDIDNKDDYIFLISSIRYHEEISEFLLNKGFRNLYISVIMEANQYLKDNSTKNSSFEGLIDELMNVPVCNNKVLFTNAGIKTDYGHNKYICNKLLMLRDDLDIVIIVNDLNTKVPHGVRKVFKADLPKFYYEVETARVVIFDYSLESVIRKRKGQYFINVKHWASVTLKSFGISLAKYQKDFTGLENLMINSENTDYIIGGGSFDEETCRENFAFKGEFLHFGSPRSDVLFDNKHCIDAFSEYYNITDNKYKYLLYAPTFRLVDNRSTAYNDLDFQLVRDALEKSFGGDWKIILRLHPNVAAESQNINKADYIIDASDYPDSQELVAISDAMITDYSSIMFEPAFVHKPVFLFAPDRYEYINGERELLIDYDALPFTISETNEQLAKSIICFDNELYVKNVDAFMDKYDVHEDGHAGERAARFISGLIDGKE